MPRAYVVENRNRRKEGFILGVFYRSPNSQLDNDKEVFHLISNLSKKYYDNFIIVGDFNFSSIDWNVWMASGNVNNSDELFLVVLRKNGLMQHMDKPTRQRGDDELHILDLVISINYLSSLDCWSPLGKTDHVVLKIVIEVPVLPKVHSANYSYLKGKYEDMRKFLYRDWERCYCQSQTM